MAGGRGFLLTSLRCAVLCCAQVLAEDAAYLRVALDAGNNAGYQFKTHPNIDKALYASDNTLGLKDPDRPFPTGAPLGERRALCCAVLGKPLSVCWAGCGSSGFLYEC